MKDINKNSIIAKILASENIQFAVQENLDTASFDLKNRIIRVPENMYDDEDFTTMLTGHEVGHCIFTPYEGWTNFRERLKTENGISEKAKKYGMSCLNILEDVRVDKLMQRKYPGLIKYYKNSTKFIVESDFFKIKSKNKNIKTMSFLNRLCVYSKCDIYNTMNMYNVSFNEEEKQFVDKIYRAETFDEICDLSIEVLKKFKITDDNIKLDDHEESSESSNSGDASKNAMDSDIDGRLNIDEELIEKKQPNESGENENSSGGLNSEIVTLYDLWEQNKTPKANIAISNSTLNKLPSKEIFELKNFKTVSFNDNNYRSNFTGSNKALEMIREYEKYVNLFSTKFNQKKRARELTNNFEKDFGILDPLKLHKYKYDDKIFQKKDIENHQKNHGFIFLIDCSSSMSSVFETLTMQMIAFYRICERIDVPYAFYGYTDGNYERDIKTNFGSNVKFYKFMKKGDKRSEIYDNMNQLIRGNLRMGGTPTSDALLGLIPEMKSFMNSFTPDIMNLIVITDGSDGTYMSSNALTYKGAFYKNEISPRGVIDNNAAIYKLLRDTYGIRIFHMDLTENIPSSFLSSDEVNQFKKEKFLSKQNFGGANNVLWISEHLVKNKSTNVIDNLVNILA